MGNTITKEFKKSAINANCDYDYCQVEQKRDYFMNCTIEQKENELVYEFEPTDSIKIEELKKRSLVYKYLFLINIYLLKESKEKLDFSIHPDNLYVNANVLPCVLMRDVYQDNQYDENIFVKEYKSVIGYLLGDKYTFDDYYNGGEKLLQKHKATAPFYELNNIEQIKSKLNIEFNKFEETTRSTKVEVNKKGYRNLKIYSRTSVIIILVLAIVTGYFILFKIPENNAIMKSNESFISQDYITTMEALEKVPFENLTKNSKYIYTVSYIKSDALSNEQKNNILASVTLTSNDKILDFWIYLSRKNFSESIDLAKQLGNKQYLLYGYLKQKSYTETDGSLNGSERETKLKEIESSIKELTDNGIKSPNENEEVKEGN